MSVQVRPPALPLGRAASTRTAARLRRRSSPRRRQLVQSERASHAPPRDMRRTLSRLAQKIARAVRTLLPRNRVAFVAKRGQCYDISCYSNHWEPLLGWRVGQGTKISQGVSIPCWIKERHEYAVACLRGLLETDGSMYVDRGYPMVMFVNACEPLARDVAQLMTSLDFAPRTSVIASKRPRPVFHVRLSKHVADFLQLVRPMKGARAGAFPGGSRVP